MIDGKWYNVDTTWDDPENHTEPLYYKNNYLLVPDSQINGITHFPVTTFTPPAATSLDANYFVKYGCYATTADQAVTMMQAQMTAAAKGKVPLAQVKCSTKAVYDAAVNAVLGKAIAMQDVTNKTAGANKITGLSTTNDASTLVIQLNLTF